MRLINALIIAIALIQPVSASDPIEFLSADEEQRFNVLIAELRCLVCQNQNLKDSDAPLAEDLRQQVLEQIRSGADDGAIKQYLVDRYGDFVLYRPPLQGNTLVLWLAPLVLLLAGAWVVLRNVRQRNALAIDEAEEQAE